MTTIITRHNETPGIQPSGGSVAVGELCVNTGDGTLWTSSDGGNIVPVGGGGAGDLPVGSTDGQMLKWTQTGSPTWAITDDITVTADNNIAVGGPQYSASYKLTVTGNTALGGDLLVQNIIGAAGSLTSLAVTTDPSTSNAVARKSYLDTTYAPKTTAVTTNTTQTISGTKTFSGAVNINGLSITGSPLPLTIQALKATSGTNYLKIGTTGIVTSTTTLAAADVEIAPGENLADTIAALKAQIVLLGGTI